MNSLSGVSESGTLGGLTEPPWLASDPSERIYLLAPLVPTLAMTPTQSWWLYALGAGDDEFRPVATVGEKAATAENYGSHVPSPTQVETPHRRHRQQSHTGVRRRPGRSNASSTCASVRGRWRGLRQPGLGAGPRRLCRDFPLLGNDEPPILLPVGDAFVRGLQTHMAVSMASDARRHPGTQDATCIDGDAERPGPWRSRRYQ